MRRYWLALLEGSVSGAHATAPVATLDGQPAGMLAAWRQGAKPVREALRVDGRLVDPAGAPAWVSLVLPPAGVRLPFDDLAVQQARRISLARPPLDGLSTLLRDDSHFAGSVSIARTAKAMFWLRDDPFTRLFPGRLLSVEAGVLGSVVAPAGPTIERYGSCNPWPWDSFT